MDKATYNLIRLENDTRFQSSLELPEKHPDVQSLIELGDAAIRPILRRLRRTPHILHCVLLRKIVGSSPVAPEDRGIVKKMAAAWLAWGRERSGPPAQTGEV